MILETVFSPDRTHRYTLVRPFGPRLTPRDRYLNVIALNPSTADETHDDPTVRRCIGFAKREGMDGLIVTNIFAIRGTDPAILRQVFDPVGSWNDAMIVKVAASAAIVVAAWGAHGSHLRRGEEVRKLLARAGIPVHCFDRTVAGYPKHPLYLPASAPIVPFPVTDGERQLWQIDDPAASIVMQ